MRQFSVYSGCWCSIDWIQCIRNLRAVSLISVCSSLAFNPKTFRHRSARNVPSYRLENEAASLFLAFQILFAVYRLEIWRKFCRTRYTQQVHSKCIDSVRPACIVSAPVSHPFVTLTICSWSDAPATHFLACSSANEHHPDSELSRAEHSRLLVYQNFRVQSSCSLLNNLASSTKLLIAAKKLGWR